jgi:hypothetical protein
LGTSGGADGVWGSCFVTMVFELSNNRALFKKNIKIRTQTVGQSILSKIIHINFPLESLFLCILGG